MAVAVGLAKMEAKHDYDKNLFHESKAKSRTMYTTPKLASYPVNNELSQSPILGNSSVKIAQRLHGLKPQRKMEKFSMEPTRSKEPTLRRKAQGTSNKAQDWKRLVRKAADNAGFL